jgi:hypothetical protein
MVEIQLKGTAAEFVAVSGEDFQILNPATISLCP